MNANALKEFFDERLAEVTSYVQLLRDIEHAARAGPPTISGIANPISVPQQKILYSSLYLQLYNLVEATIAQCVDAIGSAAALDGRWHPADLRDELRTEWIRVMARTHTEMSPRRRLELAVEMCNHLIDRLPVSAFKLEVGGGGNWDDKAIEEFGNRVGLTLTFDKSTVARVKRPIRDDLGALGLVKNRRNRLAHGAISFVECADGVSVDELEALVEAIGDYLKETINLFVVYIDSFDFLHPSRKPVDA